MTENRAIAAIFTAAALSISCGSPIAPADELPCASRGSIAPGAISEGSLGIGSCTSVSPVSPGDSIDFDRWTLTVHPDTIYVVSAQMLAPAGSILWQGRLLALTPTVGDTLLRTGFWGRATKTNGDEIQEMFVADTVSRAIIVQLERPLGLAREGYRLEVRRCAIHPLTPDVTSSPLTIDAGCPIYSAGLPGLALFFSYPSTATVVDQVVVNQAGTTTPLYWAWASHPLFDFACWYSSGNCDLGVGGAASFTIVPYAVTGVTAGVIFTLGPPAVVTLTVHTVP